MTTPANTPDTTPLVTSLEECPPYKRMFANMTWEKFKAVVNAFIARDRALRPEAYKESPLWGAELKSRIEGVKGDGFLDYLIHVHAEEVNENLEVLLWPGHLSKGEEAMLEKEHVAILSSKEKVVPVAGDKYVIPVEGKEQVVIVEGKKKVIPAAGKKKVIIVEGREYVVPVEGKEYVVLVEGKEYVVPVAGKEQVVIVAGKEYVVPMAGKEYDITVLKKHIIPGLDVKRRRSVVDDFFRRLTEYLGQLPTADEKTAKDDRRKRGPSPDVLEVCIQAVEWWLDKAVALNKAAQSCGCDDETVLKWLPNVLAARPDKSDEWRTKIRALGKEKYLSDD